MFIKEIAQYIEGKRMSEEQAIETFLEAYPYPLDDMYGCGFDQWDELNDFMENKGFKWNDKRDAYEREMR